MKDSVYITCGECDFGIESLPLMIEHILQTHPNNYTPEEAADFAELWEQDAFEREDLEQLERTEFYKLHGVDPESIDEDPL